MIKIILIPSLFFLILAGCTPVRKLKYTVEDSSKKVEYFNDRSEKTIQPYDYLYIKIYSLDQQTNAIFSQDERTMDNVQLISYAVNDKGYIYFPFIGAIYVKDLTIDEAKIKLENELNKYLTNISVRLRFVGNKITLLGELNRPGICTFFDEKISVFEAFGLAGDIGLLGDKTKVTLIREKDNKIKYHYLDLTDKDIAQSEFYFLLPNDILIVDPVNAKYRSLRQDPILYLVFSAISAISTTVTTIYFITKW